MISWEPEIQTIQANWSSLGIHHSVDSMKRKWEHTLISPLGLIPTEVASVDGVAARRSLHTILGFIPFETKHNIIRKK